MRSDIDNMVNTLSSQIWDSWSNTNNALARRASEILEAKSKLQMHLHKVNSAIAMKNSWLIFFQFLTDTTRNL